MNVTICSPFRDSAAGIAEYFHRLARLDHPVENLRFVFVEGDSEDETWAGLRDWIALDEDMTLIKCDTGKPRYGSVVNAERFQVLAQVFNAALDAVDLEWSDYVLFLPSDIRYAPDLLSRLLAVDKDIVSPFVWLWLDGRHQFYDLWGFSYRGKNFTPFRPETAAVAYGKDPIEIDTVGGVTLIKADVLKAGCRYTPEEVDRGLCKAAKAKGFTVWADPTTHVYHPPFAEEDHGLSDVYSRDVERMKAGIWKKYRFVPPDSYVKDLIAFMSEFTHDRE